MVMHKMDTVLKRFPVTVPIELHTRFKTMCAAKGQLMSEVVRALLERELAAADAATAPKIKPVKKPGRVATDAHA
jgi:ParG